MAGPSPTLHGSTVSRGLFIRRTAADGRGQTAGRGGRAVKSRPRSGVVDPGIEALEDRRLLSVALVSANPLGQAGLTGVVSNDADASDDGRYVVFTSFAADLVQGVTDTNSVADVFRRDTQANTTAVVSSSGGAAVGGRQASISSTGRYVAFATNAKLVVNDNNGSDDVYLWDAQAPATFTLITVGAGGSAAGGTDPSISDNGRVVAFVSSAAADQFVTGATDGNAASDVFVRNLDAGTTVLISSTPGTGATGNARADQPALSGDGAFVAFRSQAGDLTTSPETPGEDDDDVFRRAVASGSATALVSVASSGGAAVTGTTPSINDNGNLVAFASDAANVAAGDGGAFFDVFVRDMQAGATEVVSATAADAYGNASSTSPSISGDGSFVAFLSAASNFFTNNATGSDVVLKSRVDKSLRRVSETEAGDPASAGGTGQSSTGPSVNQNGTAVAFATGATNLVPGTEPPAEVDEDVFVWKGSGGTPGGDTAAPTATASAPEVTAAGATLYQLTILYADNDAVDVSTLGADDITVAGPGAAGAALAVTGATATPPSNGPSVSVVYDVTPPGGSWDAADNGTYTITRPVNAVRDASGNGVAAGTATFVVNIPPGGGGTPGGADLVAAVAPTPSLPAAVVGGTRGRIRVLITNQGDAAVASPVGIRLRAVPTGGTAGSPTDITTITRPLRLKPGKSRPITLPFVYPSVPDGTYNVAATVDPTNTVAESDDTNNTATSTAPVAIAMPVVDLVPSVGSPSRGSLAIGRRTSVSVTIANNGNVPASGLLTIDLFSSADSAIDSADLPLARVAKKIKLRNGTSRPIRVSFVLHPSLAVGQYFLTVRINGTNAIVESSVTNNTAVSAGAFQAS